MAVVFDGGVILGADSRTTTGSYIANRVTDKLTPIHDLVYCCRSGSAADTQAISDMVRYELSLSSMQRGDVPSVEAAATLFKSICYQNKDSLQAGIIVAGWDKDNGGSVYNIPLGGSIHKSSFAIGGSGSTYIYGYCDSQFKEGMTREESEQFVLNSLSLAMSRDGSSGGVVRLAIIDQSGVTRKVVQPHEQPKFWQG